MALTERQQQRVARFVHEVQSHLNGVDDDSLRRVERQIQRRVADAIGPHEGAAPRDEQLEAALAAIGSAEALAARFKPAPDRPGPWAPDVADRRWLGVCAGIAREMQLDPRVVRGVVLVIGLVTIPFTPLSLWVYLIAYGVMGIALQPPPARERLAPWTIARAVLPLAAIAIVLHVAVHYFLRTVAWGLSTGVGMSLAGVDERWTWYPDGAFRILTWALAYIVPLAAMSAMPVRPDWQPTFRKLAQAAVALFSVYLAYGVGTLLAGIALTASEIYDGPVLSEIIQSFALPF